MDEDVVHINHNITFIDEFSEEVVHHRLEGGGGVCEAKEHDHGFEEASIRFERSFPLVAIAHANVIVPPTDIQLRKERRPAAMHSCESIHELSNEWEWSGVANSECVQPAVVLDGSEITILFLDKCYDHASWTIIFSFTYSPLPFHLQCYGHPPSVSLPCGLCPVSPIY